MTVRIGSSYARERTASAYDMLASLRGTGPERLAEALGELSLLNSYQDQFSERGRQMYDEIRTMLPTDREWAEAIRYMHYTKRERLAVLLSDLFHDTQTHYYNP